MKSCRAIARLTSMVVLTCLARFMLVAVIRERVVAAGKRRLERGTGDGIFAEALMKPQPANKDRRPEDADEQLPGGYLLRNFEVNDT